MAFPFGYIVLVCIHYAFRINETSRLEWGHITPEYITLPAHMTKNKQEHKLPNLVGANLALLPRTSDYLFPSAAGTPSERMAWFLRNGLALLIEAGDATLAEMPPLYFGERHRKRFVQGAKTDATKQFWLREYPAYPEDYRREAPGAIINRVGQLLAAPSAAAILTQRTSTLDLPKCIDHGSIVIVNIAKGTIGNNAASLFGSLLISQLRNAVMSRADLPNDTYPPVSFLIDEFHSFATLSLAQLLAESRKYNLQLTIAHQYAAQLEPEVQAAILGNVGTLIAFRVGHDDANVLIGDFDPHSPNMLTDQSPTYARMKRDLQPCEIQTVQFEPEDRGRYDVVVRASRRRFAGQA